MAESSLKQVFQKHNISSSRSRNEKGGPRCKMFSHGPMPGARGAKGLVGYIFPYVKGAKLGPGGPWPLDPLLISKER